VSALVLGCGSVGAGVARELVARGVEVTVLDLDEAALAVLGAGFPGRSVHGSALDRASLVAAGIDRVDAVAVVTGRDATNAVVALTARTTFQVPTVVARLYDPRTAELHQRMGIRTLAPVAWGVQRIADLVTATSVAPVATLGTGGVELVDVRVPALLDDRPLAELEVSGELRAVAITRRGQTTLTSPAMRLRSGDTVHVALGVAALGRLETLLGHPRGGS
jgi:trk system potassium uptake protein TrkA